MLDWILTIWHYAWSFVVILSTIVFVHEFGHYIVARWCGVRVETFSIGFGREVWGYTSKRSGTRWKFSALPFGGYVKMFGDSTAASTADTDVLSQMTESERKVSFHHKPLWAKAAVVAAGPIANFILTIGIFTYFLFTIGMASTEPTIGEIMNNTPAAESRLKVGDRILRVDDRKIENFNDIPKAIMINTGTPVSLELMRGEKRMTLTITPKIIEDKDSLGNQVKRPLIGFKSKQVTYEDIGLIRALKEAVRSTYDICVASFKVIGQMISGERSTEELKGPLGIAKLSGQATQAGNTTGETLHVMLWFIAMLSANLGMVNLFPVPVLDGGHLVYYGIEAVRGKPMAERFMELGYKAGFVLLVSLMAFTVFNDLRQLVFS